ncbi:nuclear transport factor 2 family protein [Acidobacteria bacterium AH-259-G07]|nr:nuclear transport factor 2 family protein [Acidobacteria bacterium AH-259-G07]
MTMLPKVLLLFITLNSFLLAQESDLAEVVEKYNQAFRSKDVGTIRDLLAEEVLLYEHSVRNVGLEDVFENHLKPEIMEFQDMKLEFSDVRITPGWDLALVTRQYKIQGKFRGKDISASGNETMVWKKVGGTWKLAHIHYSHPCPKPAQSSE